MTDTAEKYVAAIDQGTTSSRCIIFDHGGAIVSVDQREHRQIFPKPGWVEHDATEIWSKVQAVVAGALARAGLRADRLSALGITNQRETTVLWDRATGKPVHNAIVWQDTRTAALCRELGGTDGQDRFREPTGLPLASYFSGPKAAWLLDNVPGLRERAERGEIAFGTIDSWLIWNLTGGPDGGRHVHRRQDRRIPLEGGQVHQHGAAGVGHVRDVLTSVGAARQVPDEPGVHGAEGDLAVLGAGPETGHVVEQPGRLGAGEVGGQRQTGLLAEPVLTVRSAELPGQRGGAGVLPDDRVVHGFARGAVPQERGLALVGDAERAELVGAQSGLGERSGDHGLHLGPDLGGVVLHPPRLGEDLTVLTLVDCDDRAVLVEDDAAAGGGALVDSCDELVRHDVPFVVPSRLL